VNYPGYLAHLRDRLAALGFGGLEAPSDLAVHLGLSAQRTEPWGRLLLLLPAAPSTAAAAGGEAREALLAAVGAWVRGLQRRDELPLYALVVFPFEQKVPDELSAAIRSRQQEDAERRWGVIPWVADLEVELVDRHSGFPRVPDQVTHALTEVPRGAVEEAVRKATGPRIGHHPLKVDLGYVPVTRFVLAITVAYYLWVLLVGGSLMNLVSGPSANALIRWGANYGQAVLVGGEQWRYLTYILLHGNLLHLGMNMWAFWALGRHSEMVYGPMSYSFIYVVSGIVGGMASTLLRPGMSFSVGASGSILGLMGGLIYFAMAMPGRRVDWRGLLGPVGINLVFGFMFRGIDNYAHIGGLIAGFAAAFVAGIPGQRTVWRKAAMAATAALLLLILAGVIRLPHLTLL
jgi:membrane associated rhomboid family serine protease